MKFKRQSNTSIDINLTPLIDVVFLLLIFFMVSTSFIKETHLTLKLPSAKYAEPAQNENVGLEIIVEASGSYRIDQTTLTGNDSDILTSALRNLTKEDYSLPLTITADVAAPYQSVVTLIDVAGKLGFAKLQITTQDQAGD